ncbi:MAG: DUF6438 domain-containing protein [bacterium]
MPGKFISLFLLLIVWLGSGARSFSQPAIPKDTVITLTRTGCFGYCPSYTLTISADGSVTFEGRDYVKTKGTFKSRISRKQLQQLISEFKNANYFSLKNKYESEEDGCSTVWTDYPSATTSIRINGKSKSILHYYGCHKDPGNAMYPKGLTELESKIDQIVGTERWIGQTQNPTK